MKSQKGILKSGRKIISTSISFGYYREEYKIEIELPKSVSLLVRGDDGDYYIKNINGSISLSLDDADAELSDCGGYSFTFRFDDGDLKMNRGKGKIQLDADDSDVRIYDAAFTSIDADIDDGSIYLETSLSDNDSYRLNSQDGGISLVVTAGGGEFDISHDDAGIRCDDSFKKLEVSEEHTRLSLNNGKAKVTIRSDDASIKLASK